MASLKKCTHIAVYKNFALLDLTVRNTLAFQLYPGGRRTRCRMTSGTEEANSLLSDEECFTTPRNSPPLPNQKFHAAGQLPCSSTSAPSFWTQTRSKVVAAVQPRATRSDGAAPVALQLGALGRGRASSASIFGDQAATHHDPTALTGSRLALNVASAPAGHPGPNGLEDLRR